MSKTRSNKSSRRVCPPEAFSWFRGRYKVVIDGGGNFSIVDRSNSRRVTARKNWRGVLVYARDAYVQKGRHEAS